MKTVYLPFILAILLLGYCKTGWTNESPEYCNTEGMSEEEENARPPECTADSTPRELMDIFDTFEVIDINPNDVVPAY